MTAPDIPTEIRQRAEALRATFGLGVRLVFLATPERTKGKPWDDPWLPHEVATCEGPRK